MRIALIVEGKTETAFLPYLRKYLQTHLATRMPKLDSSPYDGRIPTDEKLRRVVDNLLSDRLRPADAVIAITDVYTGSNDFVNAQDARQKMRQWVGPNPKFFPHAAQYDFEAWLLPFWSTVARLAIHNAAQPIGNPENINHLNPPAHRIADVFRRGRRGLDYVKPRDAGRILRENDLHVSVLACSELKALVNTIIQLSGGTTIP